MTTGKLNELIEIAKRIKMTPQEEEQQRRSFAYGNTKIENKDITQDSIERAADAIAEEQ